MMDPKTGDILAMAQTPEFDLNDPKTPLDKEEQKKLESMSEDRKGDILEQDVEKLADLRCV